MKTPRGITSSGSIANVVNRIRDEVIRLRIQSTPQIQANETPAGTQLRFIERTSKSGFLARHTVDSEEGEDANGEPVLIGKLLIEVPANLFLGNGNDPYDKRPRTWKLKKVFTGSDLTDLIALASIPEETLTFDSSIATGTVAGSGLFGTAVVFTLTRLGVSMEQNPFAAFEDSDFSFWEQVIAEEQREKKWNPIFKEKLESAAEPKTYIKVPYWLTPFGYTAPWIDEEETMMGHELTGERHDVVALFKAVVFSNKYTFQNAITGALDSNCLPVDNSTPERFYYAFRPGWESVYGQVAWALLRNAGTNGLNSFIAAKGPYTDYTGKPDRWLVPTELVSEWNESDERITTSDITSEDGSLNVTIKLPILRCIKRNGRWHISGFPFEAWNLPDGDKYGFNPGDAEPMEGYIDYDYSGSAQYIDSLALGGTCELVVRALTNQENCDYDPNEPITGTNQPTIPFYAGGWQIKQRDRLPYLWRHDLTFGTVTQTCDGQEYTLTTISEENDSTWHVESKPLDVYKPPQTLFFFPISGQFQKGFTAPGYLAVVQNNSPQPEPCPEPPPEPPPQTE